jgi:hypothetical protein
VTALHLDSAKQMFEGGIVRTNDAHFKLEA